MGEHDHGPLPSEAHRAAAACSCALPELRVCWVCSRACLQHLVLRNRWACTERPYCVERAVLSSFKKPLNLVEVPFGVHRTSHRARHKSVDSGLGGRVFAWWWCCSRCCCPLEMVCFCWLMDGPGFCSLQIARPDALVFAMRKK